MAAEEEDGPGAASNTPASLLLLDDDEASCSFRLELARSTNMLFPFPFVAGLLGGQGFVSVYFALGDIVRSIGMACEFGFKSSETSASGTRPSLMAATTRF